MGGRIQRWFSFGQVIAGTVLLQALLFPLNALSPSPLWLGLVYALIHFLGLVYNVVQFSHRIALIPAGLQGRVNAGFRFIAHSLNPVGAALCCILIERIGAQWTLWALFRLRFCLQRTGAGRAGFGHDPQQAAPE